jgi:ribosomal protein S27AE
MRYPKKNTALGKGGRQTGIGNTPIIDKKTESVKPSGAHLHRNGEGFEAWLASITAPESYTALQSEIGALIRRRAWAIVRAARKAGTLTPPETCSVCGRAGVIEAHHSNYTAPLYVRWLCRDCHRELHAKIRERVKLTAATKGGEQC